MIERDTEGLSGFSTSKEIDSWIDIQRQDLRIKREFVQTHEWREYDSKAPLIIGEVPEEECEFFNSIGLETEFSVDFYDGSSQQEEIANLRQRMPKTLDSIERHLALLDDPQVVLFDFSVDRSVAQKGSSPLSGIEPHIDPALYLFSNYPTLFYLGRTKARYLSPEYAEIDEHSLSAPRVIYTAPPFAIVWKGPWDLHGGPVYKKEGERIFGVGSISDGMLNI